MSISPEFHKSPTAAEKQATGIVRRSLKRRDAYVSRHVILSNTAVGTDERRAGLLSVMGGSPRLGSNTEMA